VNQFRLRRLVPLLATGGLLFMSAGGAAAHVIEHAGSYSVAFGWQHEPAYIGEQNAVQIVVTDAAGKGVTDLGAEDLTVVVSTSGQQSAALTFDSGFDEDTGFGTPGEYDAQLIPTSPGAYTFHLNGAIHGTAIDVTETSSDTTFNSVTGTTDVEFPVKLPTMAEVVTRLDRIDTRIAALGTASGPTQASVVAANAAAADARASADRALVVGAAIGGLGILVGLVAFVRGRRPVPGSA
jgi:hypothetical protein